MRRVHAGMMGQGFRLDTADDVLARRDLNRPTPRVDNSEYAELRRIVKETGLLNKQPVYYTFKVLLTLGMLAGCLAILAVARSLWVLLLDAAFLAFVFTQIGFLAHDASHRQIFKGSRKTDALAFPIMFAVGLSWSWWLAKHNKHHGTPNKLGEDPDIDVSVMAFGEEQVNASRGFLRFMVKYQAYFFFPLLSLQGLSFRFAGISFVLRRRARRHWTELSIMAAHLAVYFIMLFLLLDLFQAMLFILVHQGVYGLYMGSVFASNHKGMPLLDQKSPMDFLRQQVTTARNIKPHPLVDFLYGGLNYQIEHHLFPNMPRNKLREARNTIQAFCRAHSVSYREVGMFQSFWEILGFLHKISAPLRRVEPHLLSAD